MSNYQIKDLGNEEIVQLCNRNESHFFDHKSSKIDGKKIQKIAVAFANADGGEFIIGIADKKENIDPRKRWQGLPNIDDFNAVFQNLSEISPSIVYDAEFFRAPDKTIILSIQIEKGKDVYQTSSKEVYIRKSAQSLLIKDQEKIQSLAFSKGAASFEDKVIEDSTIEDVENSKEIKSFLQDVSPHIDSRNFLKKQNLLDRSTEKPRAAGILLFCDEPTPIFPTRCAIKIVRYDTSEIIPERIHLKEQFTIEGSLHKQIQVAAETIKKVMDGIQIMGSSGLEKINYPPETI